MTARDELQQWVDGTPHTVGVEVDHKSYYVIDVDLARRVLAEMDEAHTWDGIMALLDEHYPTSIFPHLAGQPDHPGRDPGPRILSLIREVDRLTAERDAALATLGKIRELAQSAKADRDGSLIAAATDFHGRPFPVDVDANSILRILADAADRAGEGR